MVYAIPILSPARAETLKVNEMDINIPSPKSPPPK
jgi:hypothetical protein